MGEGGLAERHFNVTMTRASDVGEGWIKHVSFEPSKGAKSVRRVHIKGGCESDDVAEANPRFEAAREHADGCSSSLGFLADSHRILEADDRWLEYQGGHGIPRIVPNLAPHDHLGDGLVETERQASVDEWC